MTKAIPAPANSQGTTAPSQSPAILLGPSYLTPECGYSVVEGMLFDHFADDVWFPGYPLLLDLSVDYRPLIRSIRRTRRHLTRQRRKTISPRRRREIALQLDVLELAQMQFELAVDVVEGTSQLEGEPD